VSDPAPHKPACSPTILVVDDDCAIRTLVKTLLEVEGYAVLIADDGETAMKLYDQSTVAMLLTDVVMPNMNGLELADRLLRREPQLRVLFMSGSGDASRGFGCVAKPFRQPDCFAGSAKCWNRSHLLRLLLAQPRRPKGSPILGPGQQILDELANLQKLIEPCRLVDELRYPEIHEPGPVSPGL